MTAYEIIFFIALYVGVLLFCLFIYKMENYVIKKRKRRKFISEFQKRGKIGNTQEREQLEEVHQVERTNFYDW
jgi:hypothetical protein